MAKRCKVFISYSHEDEALSDSKVKVGVGYPRAFLSRLQAAIAAHDDWLTRDEIAALGPKLRSPMVLRCVDDYLAGRRYPLELFSYL